MGLTFDFHGTDLKITQLFQSKNTELMQALVRKMTYEMEQLQEKGRAAAPVGPPPVSENDMSVPGTLRDSIRDPHAELDGDRIMGYLMWGGEPTTVSYKGGKAYDYARILNEGSATHVINPLEEQGSRTRASKTASGRSERRFGKGVLSFMVGGKEIFSEYAFPEGVAPNPFMEDVLMGMKGQIIADLQETIFGVFGK